MSFLPAPGSYPSADLPPGVLLGEVASDRKVPPALGTWVSGGEETRAGWAPGREVLTPWGPWPQGALPEALGLAEGGREVGGEQAAMGAAGGHCSYRGSEYSGVKVPERAADCDSWSMWLMRVAWRARLEVQSEAAATSGRGVDGCPFRTITLVFCREWGPGAGGGGMQKREACGEAVESPCRVKV